MKVLITADTVGGVFTYALELIAALAGRGVQFHLATQGRALSEDQRAEVARLENCVLHESSFKLEWMQDPWADVDRASKWLCSRVEEIRPDLVHCNEYSLAAALPRDVPSVLVGHSCVCSWFEAVKGTPPGPEWSTYRQRVGAGLRSASVVVAPSRTMLSALERHHGPLGETRVIYNARPLKLPRAAAKEPLVFAAGRIWDEAKNLRALERIAPDLPWPVMLAGDEESPDAAPRAPETGAAIRLGRLPFDALAGWYARASIYAFPAKYEPFGLSILEAAQAGCALVLGDIASLRELWEGSAVFVPPDDPLALESAIERLIHSPRDREALAGAARRQAARYSRDRFGAEYFALYRSLTAARANRSRTCAS